MPKPSQTFAFKPISTILCYYTNSTHQIQIICLNKSGDEAPHPLGDLPKGGGEANRYFEKVVFPNQQLLFEANPESQLAIYISKGGNKMLTQLISCQDLEVNQAQDNKSLVQVVSA